MSDLSEVETRLNEEILRRNDLGKQCDAMRVRLDIMENFIKQQFPGFFAGEVGTVADAELNPIEIVYGEPQERDPSQWKEGENVKRRVERREGKIRDADGNYE